MLDLLSGAPPPPSATTDVDELSDAELDALPFGVICLDEDGTILRYNLYEARLARLDRNQVLGRNFFRDVAPCTTTDAFEGRYRRAVAAGSAATPERFEFLFDFKFGSQHVDVEIGRAPAAPRYYMIVKRREVMRPARPDGRDGRVGVQQSELAPGETTAGVRRDALEQRFVEAPWSLFAALRATCDRLAPESWQLFCTEWGVQWGRRLAIDLESTALEVRGTALKDLSMREVAVLIAKTLARQGWGRIELDFTAASEGLIIIELLRSALAEAAPGSRAVRQGATGALPAMACHMIGGCLSALLTSVAGRRLIVREVACQAAGADHCSFVVVAAPRRAVLDEAIRDGARGVAAIRAILLRAPVTQEER
jgi:photoactive yellow protein